MLGKEKGRKTDILRYYHAISVMTREVWDTEGQSPNRS